MSERKIQIVDTTLRDGEQTAGVVFANREKVRIAKLLDELGVHQIEAGIPVMGGDEADAIKEICQSGLKASIMGWNRPVIKDLELRWHVGLTRLPFPYRLPTFISSTNCRPPENGCWRKWFLQWNSLRSTGYISR